MKIFAFVALLGTGMASHLDDNEGVFTNYSFDNVKFKSKTDC